MRYAQDSHIIDRYGVNMYELHVAIFPQAYLYETR